MKQIARYVTTFVLLVVLLLSVNHHANAALEDGEYTIGYTVMHGQEPSASIANDYWEKPAKLLVKDGKITAQMGLNHSSWIVEFQTPRGGSFQNVDVISSNEGADTSVTQFPIDGISEMVEAKIHVIVPDIDYDHNYTVRFDFDENTLSKVAGATEGSDEGSNDNDEKNGELLETTQPSDDNKQTTDQSVSKTNESNPQTSDQTPVILLMSLFIVSAIVLLRKRVLQV